jgi:hypothetical protein
MKNLVSSEPVLTVASIQAIIVAAFILLAAYGVDISDTQRTAIIGFYAVVAPLVFALVARQRVSPVDAGTP